MTTFDEIRATMSDRTPSDDKALERALSILPVRTLLGMTPGEMGTVATRFDARMKQARGTDGK